MSRKADLAALTELSCRRARQGRVESTSFRHSLSPLSLALTPSFTLLPLHPATPSPPFRTTSGGLVCRRHPWFPLSPLLPPTAEPARPTPQPACSWLPGGARCAHTPPCTKHCPAVHTGFPTALCTLKCSGVTGCSTGSWGELHSCPLTAHTQAVGTCAHFLERDFLSISISPTESDSRYTGRRHGESCFPAQNGQNWALLRSLGSRGGSAFGM